VTYAELQVATNFSFLRGASHADELAARAAELGLAALAVTDRNTLAGVVRAHVAAKGAGIRLVVGARLDFADGSSVLAYPTDRAAYGRLSRLISTGARRAPKGECRLALDDLLEGGEGLLVVALPGEDGAGAVGGGGKAHRSIVARPRPVPMHAFLGRLRESFGKRCRLALHHLYRGDDARRLARLSALARRVGLATVATNDVHMHAPERRPLADVLACVREGCTIAEAGFRLHANAERHLKAPAEMARLFADYPEAIAATLDVLAEARFSLDELRYEYPDEVAPDGLSPDAYLRRLAFEGAEARYGGAVPERVRALLEHELALIARLGYAPYFLTVHDLVGFARGRGILCQGRGSAANSAVCYCLGITAVDPDTFDLLFERFVSAERNEPPDIDVDFEHERREEVIQYVYGKYGRERAGIAATVIRWRGRSAIRDVGKAMGLSEDAVAALSATLAGRWREAPFPDEDVRAAGLDPADPNLARAVHLARELMGFPRHLSQHVGGFVITRGRLDEVVPVTNAAMAERTVVEWDKDDLDALGILKVDVLALGMLTCIRKAFDLVRRAGGPALELATVPAGDPEVYDMLCRGDSLGVFQVESRAQMAMLPRLKPRSFYDLVIEVAIVRPGPIQGDMVHPYLRRRAGLEPVEYPSEALRQVLGKTLGVPLFQEQAMKIAVVAAGFTPGEADALRRAMAAWRRPGLIQGFKAKLIEGMVANGYARDFAERCFNQILGFGEYGFPESHAASFALLVYVSAWLKRHHPAAFAAALLNSQPMGFYAPAQIVRDAREHGVLVRPPDVNLSDWDCTLESGPAAPYPATGGAAPVAPLPQEGRENAMTLAPRGRGRGPTRSVGRVRGETSADRGVRASVGTSSSAPPALRLGLRQIAGLREDEARRLVAARGAGFADLADLARRVDLRADTLDRLARADALASLGLSRRDAVWAAKGLDLSPLPLFAAARDRETRDAEAREAAVSLPPLSAGEEVVEDYAWLRLSLRPHPLAFLREGLAKDGLVACAELATGPVGRRLGVAGLVTVRQRPSTARGIVFATLEDETGIANLVIFPDVFERFRRAALGAVLLGAFGKLEREGLVIHLIAERLVDLSARLAHLRPDPVPRAPVHAPRPAPPLPSLSRDFH
jgi:error-prone DNA polymerase